MGRSMPLSWIDNLAWIVGGSASPFCAGLVKLRGRERLEEWRTATAIGNAQCFMFDSVF